jgi:hypothetical protein
MHQGRTELTFCRSTLDISSSISSFYCMVCHVACGKHPTSTTFPSSKTIPTTIWTLDKSLRSALHLPERRITANREKLPCCLFFLLSFIMQFNYHQVGSDALYRYYPGILVALSVILLFVPLRIMHYRSRMCLLYSIVSEAHIPGPN